jgi:hypothetical protein
MHPIAVIELRSAMILVPDRIAYPQASSNGPDILEILVLAVLCLCASYLLIGLLKKPSNGRKRWGTATDQNGSFDRPALRKGYEAAYPPPQPQVRPRDWSAEFVESCEAAKDGSEAEAMAAHCLFYWTVDRDDWPASQAHIGRALELRDTVEDFTRLLILMDGAFCTGLFQKDPIAARQMLTEASQIEEPDAVKHVMRVSMALRAEASALYAEDKPGEAVAKAQEALRALKDVPHNQDADRHLIEHLISRCSQ